MSTSGPLSSGGPLNFPNVLHFLQREWVKYNRERTWWLAEKSELQARIAFLEGQRMGEANLKRDLLRRIKMLEHMLQKERAKTGSAPSKAPFEPDSNPPTPAATDAGREVREGRQILLQYLSEMQYTDAVIEAQAQRVRGMLDSWSPPNADASAYEDGQPLTTDSGSRSHNRAGRKGSVPGLDDQGQEDEADWDGEDDDENEDEDDPAVGYLEVGPDDEDEDEAFEVHVPPTATAEATAQGQLSMEAIDPNAEQDIPDELPLVNPAIKKKENEAAAAKAAEAADAEEAATEKPEDDDDPFNNSSGDDDAALSKRISAQFGGAGSKMMKRAARKSKGKMKAADIFAAPAPADPGLGELFDLDVSNTSAKEEAKKSAAKAAEGEVTSRKSWKTKKEFRGHLDGVRCVAFHPENPILVSAGEDALVKVWRSEAKKSADAEPLRTLRGHTAPVFASTFSQAGGLYTAGADATIISWDIPAPDADVYTDYSPSHRLSVAKDHTDSIWMLDAHPTNDLLVSGGADGSYKLWDISDPSNVAVKQSHASANGAISCGQFSVSDAGKLLLGNQCGNVSLLDVETGQSVVDFPTEGDGKLLSLKAHRTMSLAVGAYSDKSIRFFDITTGKLVHSLVAHQAAVSCIDFDPSGLYMVSVGHDRSIRMWDVASKGCVFENTTHRHKYDEAIHAVAFHPTVAKFATAGADAVVKIFT